MTIACNRHMNGRGIRSTRIRRQGRMLWQVLDNVVDNTALTQRRRMCDDFKIACSNHDRQPSLRADLFACRIR
jgi:hypothetical protein